MKHTRHCIVVFCVLIGLLGGHSQNVSDSLLSASKESPHVKFQNHFYEALKQKALENYSKSIEELVLCRSIDSLESVVFHELGANYFKLQQFENAEYNFQKAIVLDTTNFWYKESLYHLYVDQNRFEEAITAIKPLLSRHPDYKQDLANLYLSAGRYDDALAVLESLDASFGVRSSRDKIRNEIYNQSGADDKRIAHLKND